MVCFILSWHLCSYIETITASHLLILQRPNNRLLFIPDYILLWSLKHLHWYIGIIFGLFLILIILTHLNILFVKVRLVSMSSISFIFFTLLTPDLFSNITESHCLHLWRACLHFCSKWNIAAWISMSLFSFASALWWPKCNW